MLHRLLNFQAEQEVRQKERDERKKANESSRAKRNEIKACKKSAKELSKKCEPLTKCCSESQICHLEYELSATHDGIKKATMDIILKRRECDEEKETPQEIADQEVSADTIFSNQLNANS